MNDNQKKIYIAWLNDAHAMEESLEKMLEKQIAAADGKPEMQAKLQEHLDETKQHAELVRSCLARHGEEPSSGKDFLGKIAASLNSTGMSFATDGPVKHVHSSYAAEHFEIATYMVISSAAAEFGDTETVAVCNEILADEEDMAAWLMEQIPAVTATFLSEQT